MFRPTIALALAVLALVLIATGCGGSSDSPTLTAPAPAPVTKPAEAAAAAKPIAVSVRDNLFAPATIHAKVGQKITWNLDGQVAHTVTATEGAKFDSGALQPGGSFSYVTKKAGTISYLCSFHQGMTGQIVVE